MHRSFVTFALLLLVAGTVPGLAAQPTAHELTAADLEAFLDGLVPLQLAREDVAGAAGLPGRVEPPTRRPDPPLP